MKVGASVAAVHYKMAITMVDAHYCTLNTFGENNGAGTTQYNNWATDWMTKESGFNSWQGQSTLSSFQHLHLL